MTHITFIEANGKRYDLQPQDGQNLMQVALDGGVSGIVGDCGGCCSCGTCHGYVGDDWASRLPPPSADEAAMLDGVIDQRPDSRLCCQLKSGPELDGIVIRLPTSQF